MSAIFRRAGKIASPILRRRKFYTSGATELLRPATACLMLPHYFIGGGMDMVYNFYSPMKNKVVSFNNRGGEEETRLMQDEKTTLVGSSHGWLALYNSRNRGMFLSNPVSGRRIDLPPLAGKPFFVAEETPQKLIMSCPPDEDECRAVLVLFGGVEVAFCCPGRSRHWSPLGEWRLHDAILRGLNGFTDCDFPHLRFYQDFVYSAPRKRFVALVDSWSRKSSDDGDFETEVEYWDISEGEARMDRVERVRPHPPSASQVASVYTLSKYIVSAEESDQLFLVAHRRMNSNSNLNSEEDIKFHYDVYRIEDGGGLELCSSLGDLSMFVGINSQFSHQLKRNCIYFADPTQPIRDGQYVEIFDYQKRTSSPIYFPNRHHKTQTPITWITPTFD